VNLSRDELNNKLLSKDISDFYMVTLSISKVNNDILQQLASKSLESAQIAKKIIDEFGPNINIPIKLGLFRKVALVTYIDGKYYDIIYDTFVDLDFERVISYVNFSSLFDESQAEIKLLDDQIENIPEHLKNTVIIDFIDVEAFDKYESYIDYYCYNSNTKDLTDEFEELIKLNTPQAKKRFLN